jgi:hypothetical protein
MKKGGADTLVSTPPSESVARWNQLFLTTSTTDCTD